jgi:hypothetical protein
MPPVVTGSHEGEALAMCAVIVLTTQKENGAKGEDPGTKGSKRLQSDCSINPQKRGWFRTRSPPTWMPRLQLF